MGDILTFYSYKGGVGRSMALANIAVQLAKWGFDVLMIDWDLEAPGLEYFFKDFVDLKKVFQTEGIIDILENYSKSNSSKAPDWKKRCIKISLSPEKGKFHFISAGKRDDSYFQKVRRFDVEKAYQEDLGLYIEALRTEWKASYDFVLIDSRTGKTDFGGMCTIHLPDLLVLFFTATEQGLQGVVDVARRAYDSRKKLPFDRQALLSIPVLSKFDASEEFKISQQWLDHIASEVAVLYKNWLPRSVEPRQFLEVTKIPYIPYFSFGEKLPVIEQGSVDPSGIGYVYESISALIANNFESADKIMGNRMELISCAIDKAKRKQKRIALPPLNIFISYASDDYKRAEQLYNDLKKKDFNPWMDRMDMMPGKEWQSEINTALKKADIVLLCFSKFSVSKRGFLQKEFKLALDSFEERQEDTKYLIPVLFEETELPERIRKFQAVNLTEKDGFKKLLKTL
ncbi:TIR domain-containing protein, partial [candidate division KSB1 bacterium]|nr:TIR domain-containing protein [candidate division KSB1 bacterium]